VNGQWNKMILSDENQVVLGQNNSFYVWRRKDEAESPDWLIDCLRFYVPLKNFSRIIAGQGLQNLGLCSALRAFQQGGIFIVSHLLWHKVSVFPVSSVGPPLIIASYDIKGGVEGLF
jgi:hypothetical protein